MPFEIELDGPYYSMLNFFDQVGKLERIVNVSGLLVANTKKAHRGEGETHVPVRAERERVATCTATTFFSHDLDPAGGRASQDRAGAG